MSDDVSQAALREDEWHGNVIIRVTALNDDGSLFNQKQYQTEMKKPLSLWGEIIVLDILPIRQGVRAGRKPKHRRDARILEAEWLLPCYGWCLVVDGEDKTAPIWSNVLNQKQYQTEMKKPLSLWGEMSVLGLEDTILVVSEYNVAAVSVY